MSAIIVLMVLGWLIPVGLALAGRPRRPGHTRWWTPAFALLYVIVPPLPACLLLFAGFPPRDDDVPIGGMWYFTWSLWVGVVWGVTLPLFALWWLIHAVNARRSLGASTRQDPEQPPWTGARFFRSGRRSAE